jgi:hypothetical protein
MQQQQQQQQQQRGVPLGNAGRGAMMHHPAAATAAAGRYGPGPVGMPQSYPAQASRASPRGRTTAAAVPAGRGAPVQGMPGSSYPPGATRGAVPRPAAAVNADGPIDYEFLDLMSEILRLVEQGVSTNSDAVNAKVDQLQAKFARAKTALERMDGAEMTPQMQEDMFDL